MTGGPLSRVLADLQRTIGSGERDDGDARLLEQFISHADEQAFAVLLRRHASMVYGVCNRILGNAADAEDVFQATFLVLVRKARSVRRLPSVGSWLYGVAYRTALEARRAMARRRAKEAQTPPRPEPPDQATLAELREVLDLELARLPDRYRQVIVLCDLEGQRRPEVARQLRCPEGTVASRLAKARTLLAARLTRHGLTFAAGALGSALAAEAAAGVPAAWLHVTSQVAASCINGAGVASAKVFSLVQGACRTMLVKTLTKIGALLLIVAVTGIGVGTAYFQTATAGPPVDEPARNGAGQDKRDDARLEVQRLKDEVQVLQKKVASLEARLTELQRKPPEALFRGKPASFWVDALKDRDPKFRVEALTALGGIAEVDHTLIPTIVASLRDRDEAVCQTASKQLVGDVGVAAIPLLLAALKDAKADERAWVLDTIGNLRNAAGPAVPALVARLTSKNQADRIAAAVTLGEIGASAAPAVPALMKLLKDEGTRECFIAATVLGRIGPGAHAAVPLLTEMVKDKTYKMRSQVSRGPSKGKWLTSEVNSAEIAARALGGIGPAAKAALPALRELAVKGAPNIDAPTRSMILAAIKEIDPAPDVGK